MESACDGAETTPEHAIGLIVALSIFCVERRNSTSARTSLMRLHYWQVTADDAFLCEAGAEILLETARFWSSRGTLEADNQVHIRGVIGPDEYHEHIDDNAFTNVMARWKHPARTRRRDAPEDPLPNAGRVFLEI